MTAGVRIVDCSCSEETLRQCLLGRQRATEKPQEKQRDVLKDGSDIIEVGQNKCILVRLPRPS